MKKLIQTIKNIFKIEELRTRILYTLGLLVIYRLGSFIVLPGIDSAQLANLQQSSSEGLVGLLNMFSGGAFGNASIFALGVMPYISASIVIQLLGVFVPYFRKMQMEGESGRRKMNQLTRFLTIAIICIQGPAYMANLHQQIPASAFVAVNQLGWSNFWFNIVSTLILLGGTMFVMWLGERITDRGLGNGISLIIMIGIIARLPFAFFAEFIEKWTANAGGGLLIFIVEIVLLFFVFVAGIALLQAVRKVPVQYAKRVIGNKQYGGVRQYIPMKLNAAGVMPIIFAQAIMFLPGLLGGLFSESVKIAFQDMFGFWYNVVLALLIIVFTYLYTAIAVKTNDMADDLKRNGGFIPGLKPGAETASKLDKILSYLTLPSSLALAIIAILPAFASMAGVEASFAMFFGGTSLLIMVGVVIDTIQQVNSYLLNRHYDGLMKTGKIQK